MPTEEERLLADPRLGDAIRLFNDADWYPCHDRLEQLWHETVGPMRPVLQGLLQIAVSQIHLQRGNLRGTTILMGEGLGRLRGCDDTALGLNLANLRRIAASQLQALQQHQQMLQQPPPQTPQQLPQQTLTVGPPSTLMRSLPRLHLER